MTRNSPVSGCRVFLSFNPRVRTPANRLDAAADHNHRLSFAFKQQSNRFAEVFDDDLDFLGNVVRVQPHPAHQALHRHTSFHFLVVQFFTTTLLYYQQELV